MMQGMAMNMNSVKGPSNPRYKTMMCKHYHTPQGCSYGEKCQFAHGQQELRTYTGGNPMVAAQMNMMNKKGHNNPLNYKIVKCKNWEKDGTCKYGDHCTFAHGDQDIRNKTDNMYHMQPMPMMMPMMMGMDMSGMMTGMPGMALQGMQGNYPMGVQGMPGMPPVDMTQMTGLMPGLDPKQAQPGMNVAQPQNPDPSQASQGKVEKTA